MSASEDPAQARDIAMMKRGARLAADFVRDIGERAGRARPGKLGQNLRSAVLSIAEEIEAEFSLAPPKPEATT